MHKGYNFKITNDFFRNYYSDGLDLFRVLSSRVKKNIEMLSNASGKIDASKIEKSWFPDINAEVFISHSHANKELAVGLSGRLHKTFGINSFVDSMVWGYSDELLMEIDNKHCRSGDGKFYDYQKRNRSTSHVHMMLSVALSQMINRCECLIFLNTPESISPDDITSDTTGSPWIYSEIGMTKIITQRPAKEHRGGIGMEMLESVLAKDSLQFQYSVGLDHLREMDSEKFEKWIKSSIDNGFAKNKEKYKALDLLYKTC